MYANKWFGARFCRRMEIKAALTATLKEKLGRAPAKEEIDALLKAATIKKK